MGEEMSKFEMMEKTFNIKVEISTWVELVTKVVDGFSRIDKLLSSWPKDFIDNFRPYQLGLNLKPTTDWEIWRNKAPHLIKSFEEVQSIMDDFYELYRNSTKEIYPSITEDSIRDVVKFIVDNDNIDLYNYWHCYLQKMVIKAFKCEKAIGDVLIKEMCEYNNRCDGLLYVGEMIVCFLKYDRILFQVFGNNPQASTPHKLINTDSANESAYSDDFWELYNTNKVQLGIKNAIKNGLMEQGNKTDTYKWKYSLTLLSYFWGRLVCGDRCVDEMWIQSDDDKKFPDTDVHKMFGYPMNKRIGGQRLNAFGRKTKQKDEMRIGNKSVVYGTLPDGWQKVEECLK